VLPREDEDTARAARAKAASEAPVPSGRRRAGPRPKHKTRQPWKKTATNTHGFGKTSLPRKVGELAA